MFPLRFDADDIIFGRSFVVFVQGARRVMIDHLSPPQILAIRCSTDSLSPRLASQGELVERLVRSRILVDRTDEKPERVVKVGLRSETVRMLASGFVPLTTKTVLGLQVVVSIFSAIYLIGYVGVYRGSFVTDFGAMIGIGTLIGTVLVFYLSMLMHELGHAAACLRVAGGVGGIRMGWHKALLLMAVDVSPIHRASPRDQFVVAISGSIIQFTVATIVLWIAALTQILHYGLLVAYPLIIAAIMYSIVPTYRNDGYWAVKDLTGWDVAGPDSPDTGGLKWLVRLLRLCRLGLHCIMLLALLAGGVFLIRWLITTP